MPENKKRIENIFNKMYQYEIAIVYSNVSSDISIYSKIQQDSNFFYLTGIDIENAILFLYKTNSNTKSILFYKEQTKKQKIFDSDIIKSLRDSGRLEIFNEIKEYNEFYQVMSEEIQNVKKIYTNSMGNPMIYELLGYIQQMMNDHHIISKDLEISFIDGFIEEFRLIKSEYEIEKIKKAVDISTEALMNAIRICKHEKYEYDIHAELINTYLKNGIQDISFKPIVASGKNSCTLHYMKNNAQLNHGDVLLIDSGVTYEHYCADITRTIPIKGVFTNVQRAIYNIVLETQLEVISMIRPGISFKQLNDKAREIIGKRLIELGILSKNDIDKDEDIVCKFFRHNIGHFLGLDVHDIGMYHKRGKNNKIIETIFQPGMVLTVEPGIYMDDSNENIDSIWKYIGIRIEDDILVTEDGCDVLTDAVPKQVSEIERMMLM